MLRSSNKTCPADVPQCSVLGTFLFSLYFYDFLKLNMIEVAFYVDNIDLFCSCFIYIAVTTTRIFPYFFKWIIITSSSKNELILIKILKKNKKQTLTFNENFNITTYYMKANTISCSVYPHVNRKSCLNIVDKLNFCSKTIMRLTIIFYSYSVPAPYQTSVLRKLYKINVSDAF